MDYSFLMEVVKAIGFPGVMFAVFVIYHKGTQRALDRSADNMADAINELKKNNIYTLREMTRTNDNFVKQMREITDTQAQVYSKMVTIENKIDNNQFCPVMRPDKKKVPGEQP